MEAGCSFISGVHDERFECEVRALAEVETAIKNIAQVYCRYRYPIHCIRYGRPTYERVQATYVYVRTYVRVCSFLRVRYYFFFSVSIFRRGNDTMMT